MKITIREPKEIEAETLALLDLGERGQAVLYRVLSRSTELPSGSPETL